MSAPKTCECGKPIRVILNPGTNGRSRRARMGKAVALKNHDMCRECWRGLIAQAESTAMTMRATR